MSDKKTARLILEDGTQFEGYSFGAETSVSGEVVFNTAMTGYPESLTDPSYSGQILVSTYPLIGNYGVPQFTEQDGLLRFFESDRIHIRALVVSDYSFEHSHWNASESLGQWLKDNGVPGIWGVDTRRITKIIRERGVMLGKLVIEGSPEPAEFVDPNKENLAALVSTKQVETYGNGKYRIVLVDCGCKYNIVRCLTKRNATVIRVPWDYDFTQIDYDGVMLSNGPGDPQQCGATIANIRKAIALGKPIFGICLGNQLLSIAGRSDDLQAQIRSSEPQPAGADGGHGPGRHHVPEPRLRRRYDDARRGLGALLREPQRRDERRHPAPDEAVLLRTVPPRGFGRSGRYRIPV